LVIKILNIHSAQFKCSVLMADCTERQFCLSHSRARAHERTHTHTNTETIYCIPE